MKRGGYIGFYVCNCNTLNHAGNVAHQKKFLVHSLEHSVRTTKKILYRIFNQNRTHCMHGELSGMNRKCKIVLIVQQRKATWQHCYHYPDFWYMGKCQPCRMVFNRQHKPTVRDVQHEGYLLN